VAISIGHALEPRRIETVYAYIRTPQHIAQLDTYEGPHRELDIRCLGILADNTRVLVRHDWEDDAIHRLFMVYCSYSPYNSCKYCFFVCAEILQDHHLARFSIGVYEDDEDGFLTVPNMGTTVRLSKVYSYRLYTDSMENEQPLAVSLPDDQILVARYRHGPLTNYIKLSLEAMSTSYWEPKVSWMPSLPDSDMAAMLFSIFSDLLETGQVLNGDAPPSISRP
jgi:hypothetical protein